MQGRKKTFGIISETLTLQDRSIWFHCASLGEYEQGVPIMEVLKKKYPDYKLVVSFFSPSGFEVKKNNTLADVTVYLPLDTRRHTSRKTFQSPDTQFQISFPEKSDGRTSFRLRILKILKKAS